MECALGQTADRLEKAYKESSTVLLKWFFDDWAKELPPFAEQQCLKMNPVVRQAIVFLKPFIIHMTSQTMEAHWRGFPEVREQCLDANFSKVDLDRIKKIKACKPKGVCSLVDTYLKPSRHYGKLIRSETFGIR